MAADREMIAIADATGRPDFVRQHPGRARVTV